MATLRILQRGVLATIQDLGRFGYQRFGIPVAGALDCVALRLVNALVGNPQGTGCLEINYAGPALRVEAPSVRLAVVGPARLRVKKGDGGTERLACGRTHRLVEGDVLAIGSVDGAAVAYLAVAGGFAVEPLMGSVSTYMRAGLGPLGGGPLREGMCLPLHRAEAPDAPDLQLGQPFDYGEGPMRVVLGPQDDLFTDEAVRTFLSATYRVGKQADRMGLRLEGPPLAHRWRADIPSDALVSGCIQVPGDGLPIVLLADHQTAGGYAKIATAISADLPRLGRLVPGSRIMFRAVSMADAEAARRAVERSLEQCVAAIGPVGGRGHVDLDALYSANLVSGLVDAVSGEGDAI